jgi:hypothetical protein
VKKPQWFAAEVAKHGQRVLDGASTRADALAALTAHIGTHPEYVADLITGTADKELSKWLSDNAAEVATSQLLLFPELPLRMRIAPTKSAEVASMTAEDLDHARNMLLARTQNAIDGATAAAEHEREVFMAFYGKVRPLLADGLTVGDALTLLADGRAA